MYIIIGIIAISAPALLLTILIQNKYHEGSLLVMAVSVGVLFNTYIALITQFFHIFYYGIVMGIEIGVALISLVAIYIKKIKLPRMFTHNLDFVLIFVVAISILYLGQVHFWYRGSYSLATSPQYQKTAAPMQYVYPYYSDEWYAVAFIKSSIKHETLPSYNPLASNDQPFINFETTSHAFLAQLTLLLGLNPITAFTVLAIIIWSLIITLAYIFLQSQFVSPYIDAISALSILFITSGANLPGVWTLTPITIGILCLLLLFISYSFNNICLVLLNTFAVLLIYPPLIIIVAPSFFMWYIVFKNKLEQRAYGLIRFFLLSVFAAIVISDFYFIYTLFSPYILALEILIILIMAIFIIFTRKIFIFVGTIFIMLKLIVSIVMLSHLPTKAVSNILLSILEKILYSSFIDTGIPVYPVYYIVPILLLPFSLIGSWCALKKNCWIFISIVVGVGLWIFYSFTSIRLLIDYQRVVIVTALLLVLISAFGMQFISNKIKNKNVVLFLQIMGLFLFIIYLPFYTTRATWKHLYLVNKETGQIYLPAAPANQYLTQDDINLFATLKYKSFLSLPWKGTAIGIATDNFPLATKPGTITINPNLYNKFIRGDCVTKISIAKEYAIEYIYSSKFVCAGFLELASSKENLHLYKTLVNI